MIDLLFTTKYIFTCIDVYSRFVQAIPLTNKNETTKLDAFKKIVSVMDNPTNINSDQEFNTKLFNEYFKKHNIKTYFSYPDEVNKNALIERFHRTLSGLLQKWRDATNKHDWYNILPIIIDNYNNTYHRTIKSIPEKVFHGESFNYQNYQTINNQFKIGDKVRIKLKKSVFDKSDKNMFSKEVYTVDYLDKQKYYLRDESGHVLKMGFKYYELMHIDIVEYKPTDDQHLKEHQRMADLIAIETEKTYENCELCKNLGFISDYPLLK